MIRLTKSSTVPVPLLGPKSSGVKATAALCEAHNAGVVDHKFSSAIYGHKKVKAAVIKDQSGKCLFCEAKIDHAQYGDVEHFRPKGGFNNSNSDPLETPGYYWLAYDWSNLTYGCQICNQVHKKNLFPLLNPLQRARSHHDDVSVEQPTLVNPTLEDPEHFIGFRDEVAFGKDDAGRGKTTIEIAGLNRPNLCESRRELFRRFNDAWMVLTKAEELARTNSIPLPPELIEQRRRLEEWSLPSQEYSAMIKSARAKFV